MKAFAKILFYITIIIQGTYRVFRDYVFPVVNFINAIKSLLEDEQLKEVKADEGWFAQWLKKTETEIKLLFKCFRKAITLLLGVEFAPPAISNINLINKVVEYLRSLTKYQRAAFLFKLASLMLIYYYDKEELQEKQSDLLVQMAYNHTDKNK